MTMKEIPPTEESFRLLADAAGRLLTGLNGLGAAEAAAPSRLPGWTRAHVLAHLAAQAPALERLLHWARTGEPTPQYASREARDAEIEELSGLPAAELAERVRTAAEHFQRAVEELPGPAWDAVVTPFTGETCTPRRILVIRLRELELHHVDLDIGHSCDAIPPAARDIVLADVLSFYAARAADVPDFVLRDETGAQPARFGTGGPVVSGPRHALLGWLAGRTSDGVRTDGGPLPVLPPWI